MSHDVHVEARNEAEYQHSRRKAGQAMRNQVTVFAVMIFLTFIAFAAVQAGFSTYLVVPLVLLFAGVQVGLQLYYFMHLSEKGTGIMQFFIYSGVLVAFTMVLGFVTIVWI
ncbi:cytochrome C oxidase subunit IV family protein [Rummeliibacillus sp. SL167]|uniref:cytochrome C oxidase subunit IV family protein n=1 Tax=Rummeliibacillus sp. SL167 TaxID=2579792 RepID=UPI0011B56F95|nr:cytochrome C oxidase subunit IV family protein [Rummeliibacillus sp. SL167]